MGSGWRRPARACCLGARPPYGRVTAGQLRAALDTVLSKTVLSKTIYRDNARRIGETLRAAGGHMRAAGEIEALAEVKSPQPL